MTFISHSSPARRLVAGLLVCLLIGGAYAIWRSKGDVDRSSAAAAPVTGQELSLRMQREFPEAQKLKFDIPRALTVPVSVTATIVDIRAQAVLEDGRPCVLTLEAAGDPSTGTIHIQPVAAECDGAAIQVRGQVRTRAGDTLKGALVNQTDGLAALVTDRTVPMVAWVAPVMGTNEANTARRFRL